MAGVVAFSARRTRTMKLCSFNARSKGQPWPLLLAQSGENRKALAWANGTSREIDCEAIGGRGG